MEPTTLLNLTGSDGTAGALHADSLACGACENELIVRICLSPPVVTGDGYVLFFRCACLPPISGIPSQRSQ